MLAEYFQIQLCGTLVDPGSQVLHGSYCHRSGIKEHVANRTRQKLGNTLIQSACIGFRLPRETMDTTVRSLVASLCGSAFVALQTMRGAGQWAAARAKALPLSRTRGPLVPGHLFQLPVPCYVKKASHDSALRFQEEGSGVG